MSQPEKVEGVSRWEWGSLGEGTLFWVCFEEWTGCSDGEDGGGGEK